MAWVIPVAIEAALIETVAVRTIRYRATAAAVDSAPPPA
jgi:hypothetical protein